MKTAMERLTKPATASWVRHSNAIQAPRERLALAAVKAVNKPVLLVSLGIPLAHAADRQPQPMKPVKTRDTTMIATETPVKSNRVAYVLPEDPAVVL